MRAGSKESVSGRPALMSPGSVSGILQKGGTILRTFRYPQFATAEGAADLVAMHYETSEQDLLAGLQLEQALAATLERDGLNGWRM